MPNGTVTQMEARLLKELVNREIHPIRCASSCGRKAQKGLMLGDLCAETRHLMWALKIWKFTLAEIHSKDYDDWIEVRFNTDRVQLKDVIPRYMVHEKFEWSFEWLPNSRISCISMGNRSL